MLSLWCSKNEFIAPSRQQLLRRDSSDYSCSWGSRDRPRPTRHAQGTGYQGRSPWLVSAVPLDQHRSDEAAIGSAMNDDAFGLAEAIDEILACLIGIVGGLLHAKSEIAISRSNPGVA